MAGVVIGKLRQVSPPSVDLRRVASLAMNRVRSTPYVGDTANTPLSVTLGSIVQVTPRSVDLYSVARGRARSVTVANTVPSVA